MILGVSLDLKSALPTISGGKHDGNVGIYQETR